MFIDIYIHIIYIYTYVTNTLWMNSTCWELGQGMTQNGRSFLTIFYMWQVFGQSEGKTEQENFPCEGPLDDGSALTSQLYSFHPARLQYLQSQSKTKWLPSGFIKRGTWTSYQNDVVNTKMGKSSINSNMNGGQSKKWRFIAVIVMDVPRSVHCGQSGSWGWVCCYLSIWKNEEHRWWWSPDDVPHGFTGWTPPKKHIM